MQSLQTNFRTSVARPAHQASSMVNKPVCVSLLNAGGRTNFRKPLMIGVTTIATISRRIVRSLFALVVCKQSVRRYLTLRLVVNQRQPHNKQARSPNASVKQPHRVAMSVVILDTTTVVSNALAMRLASLHVHLPLVNKMQQKRHLIAHQLDSHTQHLRVALVNRLLKSPSAPLVTERRGDPDMLLDRDAKPVNVSTALM